MSFAPLGAAPLASVLDALSAVQALASATGGITFGGTASTTPKLHMSAAGGVTFAGAAALTAGQVAQLEASGGISFGGSAVPTIRFYATATGAIVLGGLPVLRVAGKPLKFYALPDSFTFRAERAGYAFKALPQSFTFRGVK